MLELAESSTFTNRAFKEPNKRSSSSSIVLVLILILHLHRSPCRASQAGNEAAAMKDRHRRSEDQEPADRMCMCRKVNDTSTSRKREEEGRETRREEGKPKKPPPRRGKREEGKQRRGGAGGGRRARAQLLQKTIQPNQPNEGVTTIQPNELIGKLKTQTRGMPSPNYNR